MTAYVVRPISDRTPFRGGAVESQFSVRWDQAEQLLERELDLLSARNVILELDLLPSDLRIDGTPKTSARATSPCVRLTFESKHGPLSYATDRFVRGMLTRGRYNSRRQTQETYRVMPNDWQHNVYAIAKGLEALRLVDRYGIAGHGEQYRGYLQIESGTGAAPSHLTSDEARRVLRTVSRCDASTPPDRQWKAARRRAHPDLHDGDRALWDQVEEAARVLGLS